MPTSLTSGSAQTALDRFGRVVIPKGLRDDLGLVPGSLLEIVRTEEGILLRPSAPDWPLVVRDGFLVYAGRVVGDLGKVIHSDRDERIRKLSRGLKR